MIEIEQRVGKLFKEGIFKNRQIVLFNINNEIKCTACALINRGIMPAGVISLDPKEKHQFICGIPVFKLRQFHEKFGKDALLIIFGIDYIFWRQWLEKRGYYEGYYLIVDLKMKEDHLLSDKRVKYQVVRERYNTVKEVCKGMRICNKLEKKYGKDIPIFIYDYSGMGDAYILGGIIRAHYGKNVVIIVKKKSLIKVLNMFQIENVEIMENEELQCLYMILRYNKTGLNMYPITPISQYRYSDITWCVYGPKLNMADMYKAYLNLPFDDFRFIYPEKIKNMEDIDQFFTEQDIEGKRVVVLSPFANTIITYNYNFWQRLSAVLIENGFIIIMNSYGDEYSLPDTLKIDFSIEKAEYVVEKAGFFIGIRSGFCDLIANADAKKIVITPEMEIYNFGNRLFDAFSFESMKIGHSFKEIKWGYNKLDILIKLICEELIKGVDE